MTIHTDIQDYTIDTSGRKQVNFPAGAKRLHRIDVEDASGAPQDMSGWSLTYIWRDVSGREVFNKTSGGGGITVGAGSGTNDRATVTIERADLIGLKGKYSGALWRTDGTNDDPLATFTVEVVAVADQP